MSQLRNIMMSKKVTPQREKLYFDYACCNTGFTLTSSVTKIEAKFKSKGLNSLSWLCGSRISNTSPDCFTIQLIASSNNIASRIAGVSYSYGAGDLSQVIEYEYDGVNVKFNGTVVGSPNVGIPSNTHPMYIGAINNNGSITSDSTSFSGDLYYWRASDANGYVCNLVPWFENGTYYLKDLVANTLISPYYGNFLGVDPNA